MRKCSVNRAIAGAVCLAILWVSRAGSADALPPAASGRPEGEASRSPQRIPQTVNCGVARNERVPYYGLDDASLARNVCQEALRAAQQCTRGPCAIPGLEAVRGSHMDGLLKQGRITAMEFDVKAKTVWGAEVFFGHVGTRKIALSFVRQHDRLRIERWSIVLP